MKRYILVFLLIAFSTLSAFSVNNAAVINYFEEFKNDYNKEKSDIEEIKLLKRDLENLAVYRFYKLQTVGSIEKRESSTTMAELFSIHLDSLSEDFFNNYNEKIAYSAFLAWVLSEISYSDFQVGTLNEMPAYSKSYNDYIRAAQDWAMDAYRSWIAYSVGLLEDKPAEYPEELLVTDSFDKWSTEYDTLDDEAMEDVKRFTKETLITSLNEIIRDISFRSYDVAVIFTDTVKERADIVAKNAPEELKEEASNLFEYWLYHSFSLVDKAPSYPEQLPVTEMNIDGFKNPFSDSENSFEEVIDYLEKNPDSMTQIVTNLKIQKMMIEREDFSPKELIKNDIESEVSKLKSTISIQLGNAKDKLSQLLVTSLREDLNLGWLRFIVYAAFIGISLGFIKFLKKFCLQTVISAEIIYLLFFANLTTNVVNIAIYSALALPLLIFTIIIISSKLLTPRKNKTVYDFLALIIVVLILIVPFVNLYNDVPEIALDEFNQLNESPYYDRLKYDLFDSKNALLNRDIDDLTSIISNEFSSTRRALGVLLGNAFNTIANQSGSELSIRNDRVRVDVPSSSNFFSIDNEPEYIKEYEDLQKRIKQYIRTSKASYKNYLDIVNIIIERSKNITKHANNILKNDFVNYLNEKLGHSPQFAAALKKINESLEIDLATEPEPGVVRAYSSLGFQGVIVGIMLFGPFVALFKKPLFTFIIAGLLIIGLIFSILDAGNLNIFVHSSAPILKTQTESNINVLFLILYSCIIVLSIIYAFTLYKKGRELT
ncbi:MAG: hypothetical protein ACOC80_04820 [Petrotogales bacterium]